MLIVKRMMFILLQIKTRRDSIAHLQSEENLNLDDFQSKRLKLASMDSERTKKKS